MLVSRYTFVGLFTYRNAGIGALGCLNRRGSYRRDNAKCIERLQEPCASFLVGKRGVVRSVGPASGALADLLGG